MKEDAPCPVRPPIKRRALERSLDRWLAVWANDEKLPEKDRVRVQEERDRRKTLRPDVLVGVIVDREDVTQPQLDAMKDSFAKLRPTAIHHPWTTRRVAGICRRAQAPVTIHQDLREVVVASTVIVAAPRGQEDYTNRTPAWEAVHLAKHRKLPITIVLPDGTLKGSE